MRNFVENIIVLWFGSLASIPVGFALCDGTQGTPDLRNNIPIGAGDSFAVDDVGGSIVHNHDFTSDDHDHQPGPGALQVGGPGFLTVSSDDPAAGTVNPTGTFPPFKSLAYIMEL